MQELNLRKWARSDSADLGLGWVGFGEVSSCSTFLGPLQVFDGSCSPEKARGSAGWPVLGSPSYDESAGRAAAMERTKQRCGSSL